MKEALEKTQTKVKLSPDLVTTWRMLSTTFLGFVCYLSIGLALASLPQFVHRTLGYNLVLAGFVSSVQSLSTVLFRPMLGRISDRLGPKKAVVRGLFACSLSGFILIAVEGARHSPLLSLLLLIISRVTLGFGEGAVATGATAWGLARVQEEHATHVISWAGVASYGAIALGAPIGLWIFSNYGVGYLGATIGFIALAGCGLAQRIEQPAIFRGKSLTIREVVGRMIPYGMVLALATGGFATIATFITLYFQSRGWQHAALPLSLFGTCFVLVRLTGASLINRHGGLKAATLCMFVESAGLACLWHARTAPAALLGAAIAGGGFALVFPAIGVEAVRSVGKTDRGAALGVYTAFLDLSLGITGPLAGVVIHHWGYPSGFLLAAAASLSGSLITCLIATISRANIRANKSFEGLI